MDKAKDVDAKKPGENPPGKFHYNPVNMAGKREEPGEDAKSGERKEPQLHSRDEEKTAKRD